MKAELRKKIQWSPNIKLL